MLKPHIALQSSMPIFILKDVPNFQVQHNDFNVSSRHRNVHMCRGNHIAKLIRALGFMMHDDDVLKCFDLDNNHARRRQKQAPCSDEKYQFLAVID